MRTRFQKGAIGFLASLGTVLGGSSFAAEERSAATEGLAEIVVTAQKKSERLEDVPVPVTALQAVDLAEQNQTRLQDYFQKVPGLNVTQVGNGQEQSISIRGITTSIVSNPTVGVTIDDVPYGSSTLLGFGAVLIPDLDPSDLAQVEVLRGPQGTLYGASSLGGLIKFVTKDPSTEKFSGNVQVLGNYVDGGSHEPGYGFRGSVNVPITDTLAVRASGFARRDVGYIDNVTLNQDGVNQVDTSGGRLSALWQPAENVSLKLSGLIQKSEGNGTPFVDADASLQPTLGDLRQARQIGEPFESESQLFTAAFNARFAGMDFTSLTSYSKNRVAAVSDSTATEGGLAEMFYGVAGAGQGGNTITQKYTQEFRLASAQSQRVEWLAGAFYTHEKSNDGQYDGAFDLANGTQTNVLISFPSRTTLSEYALFGDLTYHVTDRFSVQFGGRESKNRQQYDETDVGPLVPYYDGVPGPYVAPTQHADGSAFTYLVTPQFKFSPDMMVYARLTSGYRLGGNNIVAVLGQIPSSYDPDKTNNYELGFKGELFGRMLTIDASAYYIDWKRIQIGLFNPLTFSGYNANGGSAKSQGLELSLQARPVQGLTIAATGSLNDAHLTQDLPPTSTAIGNRGDRLPYSSRFSGSLSVDQDFALVADWTGFAGGSVDYVGARESEFASAFVPGGRLQYPAYAKIDLRLGARSASWTFNLFANNVANRRGVLGGRQLSALDTYGVIYVQPRTVGMSVSKNF